MGSNPISRMMFGDSMCVSHPHKIEIHCMARKISKYKTQVQFKVVRQLGEIVWPYKKLTPKQIRVVRDLKTLRPIQKQSDFGHQLMNTKKIVLFYNIHSTKTLKSKHSAQSGRVVASLLRLETRLDVLLVRAQFCTTLPSARQLILHHKVCVNSQIVTYPSYKCIDGDLITIEPSYLKAFQNQLFCATQRDPICVNPIKPSHCEINYKTCSIVVLHHPQRIVFPYKIDLNRVQW